MVPTWFTIYLTNYVINQWPTAFGPISNPSVFEVLYLLKYFGSFMYFISPVEPLGLSYTHTEPS